MNHNVLVYRSIRKLHRWVGLSVSLFLLVISATGFLLATKKSLGWVRPPEVAGEPLRHLNQLISVEQAASAAFAVGLPDLRSHEDIERIDYRPNKNHFKIVSLRGYHEVQVDGITGRVLQVAQRNDQLAEDIHDLSFFSDVLHGYGLPVIACLLFLLSATGIVIFSVPVFRRTKFKREHSATHPPV